MADTVLTELKIHEFDSGEQMSQYESEIGDNDLVVTLDDKPPADIDLSNITDAGREKIAALGMPSNKYKDLTLGASQATYTSPADGWFYAHKVVTAAASQYIIIYNVDCNISSSQNASGNGAVVRGFVPVKKGDTVRVDYTAGGTGQLRFIYAEGIKHLLAVPDTQPSPEPE